MAAGTAGTALAAGTAQRRLVSILFADLVGFTPFAEERDAEEVRETLTRYFETAQEIVSRYGGTIEKFIGDAVMAVWGAPTALEDDAERAVRAALDLVDRVRDLGPGIQARAAVLTGEAAVTVGATNQGMVAGDLVNTAARLQSVAEAGTVLVGEATQRATSDSIVFEKVGEKELKGKLSPVPAWRAMRVVAQVGGRGRTDTLEAPFVGREEEMRLLKDLVHATARERRPRLVSIIGPGGIGKSRLAWEFEKYIDGVSEIVWWHDGRSPSYGDGITFWALGEMVRQRAHLLESDDEQTTREKLAASVQEHIPAEHERAAIERALLALLGLESGVDAQQLFGAWRTFFERLAEVNPVVMVFEDLHFADQGLLDFIDHVLEWSRNSPIAIVTLARPELLEKRPTWGAGKRSFTSIYLEPLSDREMGELLAGLVPGLPQKAIAAIVARADGIPLYAVETVRMLLAQGSVTLEGGVYRPTGNLNDIAVPETLTALIAARLDGLDPADHALVADAAVLGQSFTLEALAALADVDHGMLEAQLAGLVRRELLRREADPRSPELGQYAFVQALIREVAYNTLSKKDRKARHLSAARYFEGLATGEVAGALAGHYLAAFRSAGEGAEADALKAQARLALRGAAERAAALGSHQQALTFLEQAIEVTIEPADRAELHQRAWASASESLSMAALVRHAEATVAARRELGDREATARALAEFGWMTSRDLADPLRAAQILEAAWKEFADLEETPAGVTLMAALASTYGGLTRPEAALWRERAIPIAERLDLLEELVGLLVGLGADLMNSDRPRQGLLTLRGAHALAADHGFQEERRGRNLLAFFEQWNEPSSGLELVRDGLVRAQQIGSRFYVWLMVGNGAVCALRVGEWDWALDALDTPLPAEDAAEQTSEIIYDRAIFEALRGEDVAIHIEQANALRVDMTDPQFESYDAWARSWAAFSSGRFDEALKQALRAVDAISFFHPLASPLAARAALWAGDAAAAREAMARLEATMYRGRALSLDKAAISAGIAAIEGRQADAQAQYRDVLRGWRGLGLAWDEALTVVDMVTFLGTPDAEARAAADWARETLTRLGAQPYLQRLESALSGAPRPESAPAPSAGRLEEPARAI